MRFKIYFILFIFLFVIYILHHITHEIHVWDCAQPSAKYENFDMYLTLQPF